MRGQAEATVIMVTTSTDITIMGTISTATPITEGITEELGWR
jgi:hypothetical protein